MKKPILISAFCVTAALLLLLWGFGEPPSESPQPQKRFVLLIEDDTGAFLLQLRKGMQEAAAAQGAKLAVEAVGVDAEVQAARLSDQSVSGVLLLLSDPAAMLDACVLAGLPALVLNQAIPGHNCVLSDDAAAGEMLLYRAMELAGGAPVALLTEESDAHACARSERILAGQQGVDALPWPQPPETLRQYGVLMAASGPVTAALADLKEANLLPAACLVLGVDTVDRRVRDLESGAVSAMVIDSPYAMGYIALYRISQLSNGGAEPATRTCSPALIDLRNMYLAENVKLVFPLLQ